ncbi:MAG: EF-hand domain-containing protein [Thermoanaerobaculia bacterium]|nr:EF-hand domain-containing protein [Thermoanaerobaculia bacterium]
MRPTSTTHPHGSRGHGLHRGLFLSIALLVGTSLTVVAQAQPHGGFGHHGKGGHGPGSMLFGADENGDGTVNLDELQSFLAIVDADADGVLSEEEMIAFRDARAADAGYQRREAGRHRDRMRSHVLQRLDENGDGLLQTGEVESHFHELDVDGDGSLNSDELPRHARSSHRRHQMAIGMALRAADTDEDRNITTSEWTAFLATVDEDGDGRLSFEEVRRQTDSDFEAPGVSLDQANEIFDRLDADGDGTVSEDELPHRRQRRRGPRGGGI